MMIVNRMGRYDPSLSLAFKITDVFQVKVEDIFLPERRQEESTGIRKLLEKYGY